MVKLKTLGALVLSLASCRINDYYRDGRVLEESTHRGVSDKDLQYKLEVQSPDPRYPYHILVVDRNKQRLLDLATKIEEGSDVRFLVYREVCLIDKPWYTRRFFDSNMVGTLSSKDVFYNVR